LHPACCRRSLLQQAILGLHDSLQQLGSGLAFRVGAPQQQLPALLHEVAPQLALAQDAQDSASSGARGHVELLYHMLPLLDSAEAEARVEAAVAAAAAQLGWTCSVRRFWGTTLYHPDDLPYAAFAAAAASRAEEQQQKQQQAATQQAPAGASRGQAGRPNASPAHFASLPDVMTTFRKLSQQHAAVRQPLPAPSSLPPLPPGLAQTSLAGSMDRDVRALYAAAGAEEALLQLQRLTSVDAAALPCSTSQAGGAGGSSDSSRSVADPRSAFPWEVSEAGALRRLRHYLWGDEAGAAGAGADAAPALAYFTETR
jgi:deoxyribodipyrimidine photo-lyase